MSEPEFNVVKLRAHIAELETVVEKLTLTNEDSGMGLRHVIPLLQQIVPQVQDKWLRNLFDRDIKKIQDICDRLAESANEPFPHALVAPGRTTGA